MREHIIANANRSGFNVRETKVSLDDLYEARNVFLCNTLIGAWPVASIDAPDARGRHEYADLPMFLKQGFPSVLAIARMLE